MKARYMGTHRVPSKNAFLFAFVLDGTHLSLGFLSGNRSNTGVGEKVVDDGLFPFQENSVVLLFLTTSRHLMVKKFHTGALWAVPLGDFSFIRLFPDVN